MIDENDPDFPSIIGVNGPRGIDQGDAVPAKQNPLRGRSGLHIRRKWPVDCRSMQPFPGEKHENPGDGGEQIRSAAHRSCIVVGEGRRADYLSGKSRSFLLHEFSTFRFLDRLLNRQQLGRDVQSIHLARRPRRKSCR